jgi:hypothetical protein
MGSLIGGILSLTIGVVVLSGVFIGTVKSTNTSGWTTSEVSLFGLLTLVGIAGLVYGVLGVFGIA